MITYHCKNCGYTYKLGEANTRNSECPCCGHRAEMSSKLYWCDHCNVPIYDEVCPVCHSKGHEFTPDARPVFPEERLLVEVVMGEPFKFKNDSVWNGIGNHYFVNGKKIDFSIRDLKTLDAEKIRAEIDRHSSENSYDAFNQMITRWVKANAEHFNFIDSEAREYVAHMVDKYAGEDGNSMFVSFSGGKDSTVVSDLVRRALSRSGIIHIFGNTTLEFPQTYEYIQRFRKENRGTPVLRAENKEQDFFNLCETFGPPSRMLRWCCTIFKTGFINEKIQNTFGDRKTILTFYGIRRSESTSRSNYERESRGKKISQQLVASPIIDWIDYDIWLYLLTTGIDFNDAYRLGYTRVGCWLCPNNSAWSQFLSGVYMPEQSKRFHDILYDFAVKMGKTDPEEYVVNGGWKARSGGAGVDLSKNVAIEFKPCATDALSFNYTLNKPIDDQLYELFKPFGELNFDMGKARLGEVYILDPKTKQPLIKMQGRKGSKELRLTILHTPIANRTKNVEIEMKFKCQITKFQLCTGCHACEGVCRFNAIHLVKKGSDTEYEYKIDESKCVHCYECIGHFTGGCYMRRVLFPRGKGYVGK